MSRIFAILPNLDSNQLLEFAAAKRFYHQGDIEKSLSIVIGHEDCYVSNVMMLEILQSFPFSDETLERLDAQPKPAKVIIPYRQHSKALSVRDKMLLKIMRETFEMNPSPCIAYDMGKIYYDNGDYETAKTEFARCKLDVVCKKGFVLSCFTQLATEIMYPKKPGTLSHEEAAQLLALLPSVEEEKEEKTYAFCVATVKYHQTGVVDILLQDLLQHSVFEPEFITKAFIDLENDLQEKELVHFIRGSYDAAGGLYYQVAHAFLTALKFPSAATFAFVEKFADTIAANGHFSMDPFKQRPNLGTIYKE